jgi:hypothetical protein
MRKVIIFATLFLAGVAVFPISSSLARQNTSGSQVPITTVVTVLGHNFSPPPTITKEEITVYSGKNRQDVVSWVPAQGDKAGLQLAILIDNSDSTVGLGSHLNELENFIKSQPSSTQVGVFYAANGTVETASEFSPDHDAVAQTLRLPLGRSGGASPSVYDSLQHLVSHWPANDMRHEVLIIASGVDHLYPGPDSPYVASALKDVQAAGVVVHTIYTGGARLANASFRLDIAQSNLTQIAQETGGQPFFQGLETPVDFQPLLRNLEIALNNQYWLTFTMPRSDKKNGEMRQIQVRTEQRKVKLEHAEQVFVPGP